MREQRDKTCRDRMIRRRFTDYCSLRALHLQEPIHQSISLRQCHLPAFHRLDQPERLICADDIFLDNLSK